MPRTKQSKPDLSGANPEQEGAGEYTPRVHLTAKRWAEVRRDYGKGDSARELSEKYGVNPRTINRRAQNEGWAAYLHDSRKNPEEGQAAPGITDSSESLLKYSGLGTIKTLTSQDFQNGISSKAKKLLLDWFQDPAPLKSWQEVKILNDLIRKADGLDSKELQRVSVSLVSPLRTVTRRSAPIEAEEV